MSNENSVKITKDAFLWLLSGGAFAVILATTLFYVDERLATSTGEHDKNVLLNRVRTAQAELSTGIVDPRQINTKTVSRRLSELEAE